MQASTSAQGAHGWRARTHAPSLKRAPTHWRTRQTPAHAAPPTSSLAPRTARERVLELLAQGQDNYNHTDELRQAVEALIPENPTRCPGLVIEEGLGTGTWKVGTRQSQHSATCTYGHAGIAGALARCQSL